MIGSAKIHSDIGELTSTLFHLDQCQGVVNHDTDDHRELQVSQCRQFSRNHLQTCITRDR